MHLKLMGKVNECLSFRCREYEEGEETNDGYGDAPANVEGFEVKFHVIWQRVVLLVANESFVVFPKDSYLLLWNQKSVFYQILLLLRKLLPYVHRGVKPRMYAGVILPLPYTQNRWEREIILLSLHYDLIHVLGRNYLFWVYICLRYRPASIVMQHL